MKAYKVNVNGNTYEVTLEVIDKADVKAQAPKAQASEKPQAPVSSPANGAKITSPMPGNILAVNVTVGQAVKKGDVLMILEAMKMENEIMAPSDGTIASVSVTKGSSVETGTVLCVIA